MDVIENTETVVITKERYKLLMEASRELIALHAGGEEIWERYWEWYDEVVRDMEKQEDGG